MDIYCKGAALELAQPTWPKRLTLPMKCNFAVPVAYIVAHEK